jgi:hypothetical protein
MPAHPSHHHATTCSLSSPLSLTMSWKLASLPCTCWREPWPVDARHHTEHDVVTMARSCQSVHDPATGRARTPSVPVDSDHPQPSPLSYATTTVPSTSWTSPLDRQCPIDDDAIDAIRHCCQSARTMTIATDRHFLRRQVPHTHNDIAYPPASAPNPLDHCIVVVIHDLPRPLGLLGQL